MPIKAGASSPCFARKHFWRPNLFHQGFPITYKSGKQLVSMETCRDKERTHELETKTTATRRTRHLLHSPVQCGDIFVLRLGCV